MSSAVCTQSLPIISIHCRR